MRKKVEIVNCDYKAGFPGILFAGNGSLGKISEILWETNADRVIVLIDQAVTGLPIVQELYQTLGKKLGGVIDHIPPEPSNDCIRGIYETAKDLDGQLMIAIGGGSVMDMTKIVASAMNNDEFAENGFMNPDLIRNKAVTTVMIPTTAGTGAEATPNAIFLVREQQLKVGVVSNTFVASYVILEPRLTVGLPKALTASTGIDALCHAVESYISSTANPISRAFSLKAASLIGMNLEKAYFDGSDLAARENMQLASFFAGMCLFSSSTVAVHALSYPLGGKYHIPHGVSNAILLPLVLEANRFVCQKEYAQLAEVMMPRECLDQEEDVPKAFVDYIVRLCRTLQIPQKLTQFGVQPEDVNDLADNAMEVKRLLSKNPRELSREEICAIYEKLL